MSCKRSFPAPVYYWILFSTNIKWKAFEDNNISYGNSKTSLVRSNYFWWLSSIPKIIEPFEKLLGLISVIISDTKLKPDISDELVLFDEVIILELMWTFTRHISLLTQISLLPFKLFLN